MMNGEDAWFKTTCNGLKFGLVFENAQNEAFLE
jgi:hypothetical protein